MSIGYGPKWPFYSCYGLFWIDGIYDDEYCGMGPRGLFYLDIDIM